MSEGFGLFGLLSQEWEWLSAGRSARLTVERWAEEPCLAGVGSLADVVGLCHRRGDPGRSAVVLALLVRRAEDPLAVRAVVQALAPGLVRMVRRREYPGWVAPDGVWPTLSDAAADVVAFTVDVVQG